LERAENEVGNHSPPVLLTLGLVVCLAAEAWGCFLLLKSFGVSPAERLPLGIALALAVIGITAVVARRTSPPAGSAPSQGGVAARVFLAIKRSVWTLVILGAYVAVTISLVVLRVSHAASEDTPQLEIAAQALLLVATSVGPAWFAERWFRKLHGASRVWKQRRLVRARLRDAERSWNKAQAAVNRIASDGARWDEAAARRRAQYQTEHRLELRRVANAQQTKARPSRA
jgi:hypothetical protein